MFLFQYLIYNQNARIGHLTKNPLVTIKWTKMLDHKSPYFGAMKEVRVNTVYANYYTI